jgi:hypothetical protein
MVRSAERASLYDASHRQANHEAGLVASSFETLAAQAPPATKAKPLRGDQEIHRL